MFLTLQPTMKDDIRALVTRAQEFDAVEHIRSSEHTWRRALTDEQWAEAQAAAKKRKRRPRKTAAKTAAGNPVAFK